MRWWHWVRERWAIWDCPELVVFLFVLTGGLLAWSLLTLKALH
jgi:hypothetical protein